MKKDRRKWHIKAILLIGTGIVILCFLAFNKISHLCENKPIQASKTMYKIASPDGSDYGLYLKVEHWGKFSYGFSWVANSFRTDTCSAVSQVIPERPDSGVLLSIGVLENGKYDTAATILTDIYLETSSLGKSSYNAEHLLEILASQFYFVDEEDRIIMRMKELQPGDDTTSFGGSWIFQKINSNSPSEIIAYGSFDTAQLVHKKSLKGWSFEKIPEISRYADHSYWYTYTNASYGFSVDIPYNWKIISSGPEYGYVGFRDSNMNTLYVNVDQKGNNKKSLQWGFGAGEARQDGQITFLGSPIDKTSYVYEGEVKNVLYYSNNKPLIRRGNLEFFLVLKNDSPYEKDQQYDSIQSSAQATADKILESFRPAE